MSMNRNKRMVKQMAMKGENKKCFECTLKSTPYVIMDFGIFVCTKCSGIHRNFQHKVKGISMTNFKDEDIKRLKEFGGNEEARKKWRAKHDPKKYPHPKPNDEYGIRKFVDQTFIAKRWYDGGYYKSKSTTPHKPPKSKSKPKEIRKPSPKSNQKGRSERRDKKPFRDSTPTTSLGKMKPKKSRKKTTDPFGESDPFDSEDPFGDDGKDWFEDFPDDKDFNDKQKTPKEQPKPKPDTSLLVGMEDVEKPAVMPNLQPEGAKPKKEGFEEKWFDIQEKKDEKGFPDLDKLFGSAQPTPPKGRGGGMMQPPTGYAPNTGQPQYPYTPPNPVRPNPNQYPPYGGGGGRGVVQYPPYGGTGRGGPPVQQPIYGQQQPYAPQPNYNPQQPNMNPTNPFMMSQQVNTNNPFLMGNTPPPTRNHPTNIMPTNNVMGGNLLQPTMQQTNNTGGLDSIFGPVKTTTTTAPKQPAPTNGGNENKQKDEGPDPFAGIFNMGSF